mgnify:FL=1|tara:strand:- start:2889 stop:4229 length:1341 start_codon:yes stop_codon:yes gene_type:complete
MSSAIVHRLLIALLVGINAITWAPGQELDPPNFVLIVIDDIGYGDLGIYGNKTHNTPNIDQLGTEGMIFTDFHSNGAVCSPTRAALMTGQYQQRTNVEHAIGFTMDEGMPLHKRTIPEYLSDAGYISAVFGKWHLGHVSLFGPNDQGFDVSYTSNNTPDYHTHISRIGETDWYKDQQLKDEPGYLTHLVTKYSTAFIKETRGQPFFLFISHLAAHFPFQGPDDPAHRTEGKIWHQSKYGPLPESEYKRAYKDMIEAVDESVGEVVQALEETGLRDNTLIFITSDNGAYSWVGSNEPYRGEKGSLFEGGHRVPAIANWPGHIPAGMVCHETTMTMDLAPTFVALAGLSVDPANSDPFDGADLSHVLLKEEPLKERPLIWHFKNPYVNSFAYAVRDKDWKLLMEGDTKYLFNLRMDSMEQSNLITQYPERAKEMERLYEGWESSVFGD